MKILQRLIIDDTTYVFTENPEKDIEKIQELYRDENRTAFLGYEIPILSDFNFLGKDYKSITFWNDNEDIQEIDLSSLEDK